MDDRYINKIYKILPIYEEYKETYLDYLNRLSIEFQGIYPTYNCYPTDDKVVWGEISCYINGLKLLGTNATHEEVKTCVMHCISLLKR